MINTEQEYFYYLECDRVANGRPHATTKFFSDEVWRFIRTLRRVEFFLNVKLKNNPSLLNKLAYLLLIRQFRRLSLKLNFTIPANVFGPGLYIAHAGAIIVNKGAKVGANCALNNFVVIGTAAGKETDAPLIGNNVYIGPGAKIFGKIQIADGVAIGANAVVNKDILEENVMVAGVPGVIKGKTDTSKFIIIATTKVGGNLC